MAADKADPQQTGFSSDRPIETRAEDRLGRAPFAEALAEQLRTAASGGGWGGGLGVVDPRRPAALPAPLILPPPPDDRGDDPPPAGDLGGTDANRVLLCHRLTVAEAQMASNVPATLLEAKNASEART